MGASRGGGPVAGAMRKMGIYLGLVEDDDTRGYGRYDARQSDHQEHDRRYGRYGADDLAGRGAARAPEPAPAPAPQPYRITTLHPRTYNEARTIGERFREGLPVIMNLTEMDDADAKRLVDFAAGLSLWRRGSNEGVTGEGVLLSSQKGGRTG